MVTLELLIDASVWDHSTLLLIWDHTWLTFSFFSSSHLPYHSSTCTIHLHQILHFRELHFHLFLQIPLHSISSSSFSMDFLPLLHQGRPSWCPRCVGLSFLDASRKSCSFSLFLRTPSVSYVVLLLSYSYKSKLKNLLACWFKVKLIF